MHVRGEVDVRQLRLAPFSENSPHPSFHLNHATCIFFQGLRFCAAAIGSKLVDQRPSRAPNVVGAGAAPEGYLPKGT